MQYNGLRHIHPEARIGNNVTIEPFVNIGRDVEIGDGTWIGSNVCIMDGARIGRNCKIFPGAIIGAIPQDLKFSGEYSTLEIGNDVTIREYCTLNRGTKANHRTIIADHSLLMAYVHVAHDCLIGKHCVLANNVTLAGHIEIGDWAVLGGLVAVHQFVKIGQHAMVGGGSLVRKDIPPFVKAAREPLSYAGINSIGLKRRGFTAEQIRTIQDVYRILFIKGYNTSQAVELIRTKVEATPERDHVLDFLLNSSRGIMKGFRHLNGSKLKS
ncbi:MAG: acyl-ACP--UDP-N-acetylglucosamine O-acyltransferase [Saprospiraceae bacterium]|nr:acyl-ACP--UDP-N-acetylglucosamine O-acyltransferase [Saprospiraceae bacterium]MCB0677179.1 acyl-ACP--UDP-N-acetylglucosamine O-acyltransferase [Saprospiraceae bacterium]